MKVASENRNGFVKLEYLFIGWIAGATVFTVFLVSGVANVDLLLDSPPRAVSEEEIIELYTAGHKDYAKELYEERSVLGYTQGGSIEAVLYPERVIEVKIKRYLELVEQYPGARDLYLQLAILYKEKGSELTAKKYLEEARMLDPNGEKIRMVTEIIER